MYKNLFLTIILSLFFLSSAHSEIIDFIRACDRGNPLACTRVSKEYRSNGQNNYAERYAEKGCNLNEGGSCFILGYLLLEPAELNKTKLSRSSAQKIFNLIKKSCDLNSPQGCAGLAMLYERENSVMSALSITPNTVKAKQYYRKGCQLGYQRACELYKK